MCRSIALVLVLFLSLSAIAEQPGESLPMKPQVPTPTPLFREAFIPSGTDVLLSYPMDSKLGGKPIWLWKYHKRKLSDLEVTNAAGKRLDQKAIVTALKKPSVVLVSSDGNPVHPYYLRVIQPNTLVIIDKAARAENKSD